MATTALPTAWKETNATAWGKAEIKIGESLTGGKMATALTKIGIVKQDSISVESEEGEKREWKAVGGEVIDQYTGAPKLKIKCKIKNLNKSLLEKLWHVEFKDGGLQVNAMSTAKKFSVQILPEHQLAETLNFPYCAVSSKPTFAEGDGWELEVEFTLLQPQEVGKPIYFISQQTTP